MVLRPPLATPMLTYLCKVYDDNKKFTVGFPAFFLKKLCMKRKPFFN